MTIHTGSTKQEVFAYLKDASNSSYYTLFQNVNPEFLDDAEIAQAAVERYGNNLQYFSERLKDQQALVLLAMNNSYGAAFEYASDALKNDSEFCLKYVVGTTTSFTHISQALQDNEDFVNKALAINHTIFQNLNENFRNNKEFARIALEKSGNMLRYAGKDIADNEELVLLAVNNDGRALLYASNHMKNNHTIVLAAVKQDGYALSHASPDMQNNKEIVFHAFIKNPGSLMYASATLKNDMAFMIAAFKKNNVAIASASNEIKFNPIFSQCLGLDYRFLVRLILALILSLTALTLGILILAGVLVTPMPVVIGSLVSACGLTASGFFGYQTFKHQQAVADVSAEAQKLMSQYA
jgi:Domain of unknown function (DUF4116)